MREFLKLVPRRVGIVLVHVYRALFANVLPTSCRYHPSCSHYAEQAIREHGLLKGSLLSGKRLIRCHPMAAGGIDQVPRRVD